MRRTVLASALVAGAFVVPQPVLQAATVERYTGVYGVFPSGKVVSREVVNRTIAGELTSANSLAVRPTSMTVFGWHDVEGGTELAFTAYSPGTVPRVLTGRPPTDSKEFTVKVAERLRRSFAPRLVAASGTYYVYGVDQDGNLNQWTRYRSRDDDLYLANPRLVARHMGHLKTLVWNSWHNVDDRKLDLLYATSRKGALIQFQVPWLRPDLGKVTTVKRTGFANVTGLSTSLCNRSLDFGSIIAVNKKADTAEWFTLRNQLRPVGGTLVNRGRIAKNASWRISAVS